MIKFFDYYKMIQVSDLSPAERLIALAYAESYNADRENPESFKGIFRIAAETGYKRSQVSKIRASLVKKGWLLTKRSLGGSSLTWIAIPADFDYDLAKKRQDELVNEQNEQNNTRVNGIRKAPKAVVEEAKPKKEAPKPAKTKAVEAVKPKRDPAKEEMDRIRAQREADKKRKEEKIAEQKRNEEERLAREAAKLPGQIEYVLNQSVDPAAAIAFFRDSTFAPYDDDVVRAAKARNEADNKANEALKANLEW